MSAKEKLVGILSKTIYPREGVNPVFVVAEYLLDNDVLPVIRCKDCKRRRTIFCPMCHETMGNGLIGYSTDDGYCNVGKEIDEVK